MTRHRSTGLIVVLGLLSSGCISLLGPEDLRFRLSLAQGVGLDREFAIGIDGLTVNLAASMVDMPIDLKGLSWVDVGIYKIRGDGHNLVAEAELPGWEPIVRVRSADEEVKVLVKQNSRKVSGLVALIREDDELIVARLKGNIGKLLETLMSGDGDFGFDFDDVLKTNKSEVKVVTTPEDIREAIEPSE